MLCMWFGGEEGGWGVMVWDFFRILLLLIDN